MNKNILNIIVANNFINPADVRKYIYDIARCRCNGSKIAFSCLSEKEFSPYSKVAQDIIRKSKKYYGEGWVNRYYEAGYNNEYLPELITPISPLEQIDTEYLKDVLMYYDIYNKPVFACLVNILLVAEGGRRSTLIETSNFSEDRDIDIIWGFIALFKDLIIHKDKLSLARYPRYFLFKNEFEYGKKILNTDYSDTHIAELLGMYTRDFSYTNVLQSRLIGEIFVSTPLKKGSYQVYSEIGNPLDFEGFKQSIVDKVSCWNVLSRNNSWNYRFTFKITHDDGIYVFLEKIRIGELKYYINHIDDYLNLLYNYYNFDIDEQTALKELALAWRFRDKLIFALDKIFIIESNNDTNLADKCASIHVSTLFTYINDISKNIAELY